MKRSFLAAGMLGAVLACGSGPLDLGYHGSDEGYARAIVAADYWTRSCGEELVRVHRGDGDVQIREDSGLWGGEAYGVTISSPSFLGLGRARPVEIVVIAGFHGLPTLAHEYGHALGLEHEPTGIMRPGIDLDALAWPDVWTLRPGLISAEDCARARKGSP